MSFSNDMAVDFDQQEMMPFYSFALVIFGLAMCFLNSGVLLNVKHKYKIWATVVMWMISIGLFVIAEQCRVFWLTFVASILVGAGTNLGQLTCVGFMKCFPPIIVSGISSGTGMGGVLGAVLYLVFKLNGISITKTLLSMLAFYPVYGLCFYLVIQLQLNRQEANQSQQPSQIKSADESHFHQIQNEEETYTNRDTALLVKKPISQQNAQAVLEQNESEINARLSWKLFKKIYTKMGGLFLAFGFLHILMYMSITSLSSIIKFNYQSVYTQETMPGTVELLFEVLQLAFRFGELFGKSTLDIFEVRDIRKIVIFTSVFAAAFAGQALTGMTPGIWLPLANMFLVGLGTGFGWVNIHYQILDHPDCSKEYSELSLNFSMMFLYFGVILSSAVGFLMLAYWTE